MARQKGDKLTFGQIGHIIEAHIGHGIPMWEIARAYKVSRRTIINQVEKNYFGLGSKTATKPSRV